MIPTLCMYNSSAKRILRIINLGIHEYFFFIYLIQSKVSYTRPLPINITPFTIEHVNYAKFLGKYALLVLTWE